MAIATLNELDAEISAIIKQQVPSAHARRILGGLNPNKTLLVITAIMVKEANQRMFVFGRYHISPDVEKETDAMSTWELLESFDHNITENSKPHFVDNVLFLGTASHRKFILVNGKWQKDPNFQSQTKLATDGIRSSESPAPQTTELPKTIVYDITANLNTHLWACASTVVNGAASLIAVQVNAQGFLQDYRIRHVFVFGRETSVVKTGDWYLVAHIKIDKIPIAKHVNDGKLSFSSIGGGAYYHLHLNQEIVTTITRHNNLWKTTMSINTNDLIPPKQQDKIVVQSTQSAKEIIALAGMLGLELVYKEDTKLVFNRPKVTNPFGQPGYPQQPAMFYPPRSDGGNGFNSYPMQYPLVNLVIELLPEPVKPD